LKGGFFPGNWNLLSVPEFSEDLLETEERKKDRARLLLERYGILFHELLQREHPALTWSSVFHSLRIMELSGEVLTGYFFGGIPGPQFIPRQAFLRLRQSPQGEMVWGGENHLLGVLSWQSINESYPMDIYMGPSFDFWF